VTAGSAGVLLVVCTANVCRSPLAQRVLEEALADGPWAGISVVSAGTRAEDGQAMCPVSASTLDGSDQAFVAQHRSRHLDRQAVEGADLVLAMERDHRSAVARLAPGAQSKVFTLREAVALAAVLEERGTAVAADLPALARALHSVRGLAAMPVEQPKRRWFQRPVEPEDPLTIVDGHGEASEPHLAAARQVQASSRQLAASMTALAAG
jgi:protein-tyrosine phosphatase